MELLIGVFLGFVSTVIVAYISFKYFRKRIKKLIGQVMSSSDVSALINFIHKRSDEIFLLDNNLSQEFAKEFNSDNQFSSPEYNEENTVILYYCQTLKDR